MRKDKRGVMCPAHLPDQHCGVRSTQWCGGTLAGIPEAVEFQKWNTIAGVCSSNAEIRQMPSPHLSDPLPLTLAVKSQRIFLLLFSSVRYWCIQWVTFTSMAFLLQEYVHLQAGVFICYRTVKGTKWLSRLQVIWVLCRWIGAYPGLPSSKTKQKTL